MKSYRTNSSDGVGIHVLDTLDEADLSISPLLICPGLSETAEEFEALMEFLLPRRCVALSFRGRGHSDTPLTGYGLEEHVADIEKVVQTAGLIQYHMYSHSRGVSYALGYARAEKPHIRSLLLDDYPPEHRAMSEAWAEEYLHEYIIPHERLPHIRQEAIIGIHRDSEYAALEIMLPQPVLVMHGMLDDSMITEEDLNRYKLMCADLTVRPFAHSGHGIRMTEEQGLYETIRDFLNQCDK
ncbi:alpha/beta fold hydrolase [Paenibacillus popilliae]|nr:alpha/beta fold hydrolase [Paenibacillus sp. SDF0028]